MFKVKALFSSDIIKSSSGILLITLLVKVLGYVEKLLLAKYFGTSYQVDVYTVVLSVIISVFIFSREIIEPGFLNTFLNSRKDGNESESWGLFNFAFKWLLILTFVFSVAAVLFPGGLARFFAPGFEGETLRLTKVLIRVAIPSTIFLVLSSLTNITLNGLKLFVLPASGELAFKAGILLFMWLAYKEYGIIGAAAGMLAGSAGKLAVHLVKLYKKINLRQTSVSSENKRTIWRLTWPLLLGVGFSQASGLIDNGFASYLQEGAISALSYAKKVVELPVVLFPYAISIVIFPYFTQLKVEKQNDKLFRLLFDSLKWLIIAFLPLSIYCILYASPIIELIFQRGAFDADSTALTALPFMIYSFGLTFFAIETILVIFYYSSGDTKTPVFVGMACVVLNIALTWLFVKTIGYTGIALAFVIQKAVKNIVLLYLLKRKVRIEAYGLKRFLPKVAIALVAFGLIAWGGQLFLSGLLNKGLIMKAGLLAGVFVFASAVYLFALKAMNLLLSIRS